MGISRRELLKHGLAHATAFTGLSSFAFKALAAATERNDFNFVIFRLPGGMDSSLAFHPWTEPHTYAPEDLWLNYDVNSNDVMKNVSGTPISLGLSARAFFPFVRQMAVVRGLYIGGSDIGHPPAIHHISAGRGEGTPQWPAYIGEKYASEKVFALTNSTFERAGLPPFPAIMTSDLRLLRRQGRFETKSRLDSYGDPELGANRYLHLLRRSSERRRFADIVESQVAALGEAVALQDETLALAALAANLVRVVQIDFVDEEKSLDTHSMHENHHPFLKERLDRVAGFLTGLETHGLMEKTLVVVLSEFNRSPNRNDNSGKDHNWDDNAVALFGRGVRGGSVIGDHVLYTRSKDVEFPYWSGNLIDYRTGRITDMDSVKALQKPQNGRVVLPDYVDAIRPADLWTTIVASLGPELKNDTPIDGKIIPGVFTGF